MPWILNEDAAVLQRLSGVTVPHSGGLLTVPVRFAAPEPESADMTFPSIVITRTGAYPVPEREHRGTVVYPYKVGGNERLTKEDRRVWYGGFPVPYHLDYQVSVFTRLQQHQTFLTGVLGKEDRIPHRGGSLHIPELDVNVSMDLAAGPTFSSRIDDEGKRLFEIYYLVRVFSEFAPWDVPVTPFPDHVAGTLRDRVTDREFSFFDETTGTDQ